jgi:hypothetical protein
MIIYTKQKFQIKILLTSIILKYSLVGNWDISLFLIDLELGFSLLGPLIWHQLADHLTIRVSIIYLRNLPQFQICIYIISTLVLCNYNHPLNPCYYQVRFKIKSCNNLCSLIPQKRCKKIMSLKLISKSFYRHYTYVPLYGSSSSID